MVLLLPGHLGTMCTMISSILLQHVGEALEGELSLLIYTDPLWSQPHMFYRYVSCGLDRVRQFLLLQSPDGPTKKRKFVLKHSTIGCLRVSSSFYHPPGSLYYSLSRSPSHSPGEALRSPQTHPQNLVLKYQRVVGATFQELTQLYIF